MIDCLAVILIATHSSEIRRTQSYEFHLNFARNSRLISYESVLESDCFYRSLCIVQPDTSIARTSGMHSFSTSAMHGRTNCL